MSLSKLCTQGDEPGCNFFHHKIILEYIKFWQSELHLGKSLKILKQYLLGTMGFTLANSYESIMGLRAQCFMETYVFPSGTMLRDKIIHACVYYFFSFLCAILWVIFSILLNTSLCSFSSVWNTLSNFLCSAQYFEQDIYILLSKISIHCWGLILFPNSSSFFIQGKKQEATIYNVKNKKQQSSICFYLCCWRICSSISIFHLKGSAFVSAHVSMTTGTIFIGSAPVASAIGGSGSSTTYGFRFALRVLQLL